MKKISILLRLAQLCCLLIGPSAVVSEDSSDNAIARVTGARNGEDSIWMKVVEDNSTESGWAVDMLRNANRGITDSAFKVYMYAKEQYRPRFRHYFNSDVLCALVSKKSNHPKPSFDHFMPTQIMKMIFPGRQGSCTFKKGKKAIVAKAPVNADRRDSKNEELGIPYSFPFDLMVSVIRASDANQPLSAYTIQVNFTVDLVDSANKNGNKGIVGKVIQQINNTAAKLDRPINVPVRVIGVSNGMDNPYFSAVEDKESATGWAIKVAERIRRYIIDWDLMLDLYDVVPVVGKTPRPIFSGRLCDALVFDSRFNGYPESNYLPRQIVDLIFPGHQGSCDFEQTTIPMEKKGTVNLNPFDNPDVALPRSPYFNLIANVRQKKYADKPIDTYAFQVNFTVGYYSSDVSKKVKDTVKNTIKAGIGKLG